MSTQHRHGGSVIAIAVFTLVLIGLAIWLSIVAFQRAQHWGSSSSVDPDQRRWAYIPRYLYLYNTSAQTGITGAIAFDSQGQSTPGFVHPLGSTSVTLETGMQGVYDVSYTLQLATGATGANQFAIAVNGSIVAGTTFAATSFAEPIVGRFTLQLFAGSVVTLVNVAASSVDLAALPNAAANASLFLKKIK